MKRKNTNRQRWIKPELIQIKLNPEQAVLSCCDFSVRGMNTAGELWYIPSGQCWKVGCFGETQAYGLS
ncbi:MAG: hypothetical protein PHP69_02160 [Candidatus Omnitrophica bacterium]|nr:hypothetical protein [Candidatus Omnitrophota bacterium]MDD5081156.1 hypothetical protein [Candidatus Omnitrophota bacterium]MDD5440935.1 hypothetical protein [Candidatus Omnitrophota bacterium]